LNLRERRLERNRRSLFIRPYEQVLVEASHFVWAFSQEAFVLCSAAKVGVKLPIANPNAITTVRRFFMEASPGE
jgi:hypothetical protein